jgi:TPR repeat protein
MDWQMMKITRMLANLGGTLKMDWQAINIKLTAVSLSVLYLVSSTNIQASSQEKELTPLNGFFRKALGYEKLDRTAEIWASQTAQEALKVLNASYAQHKTKQWKDQLGELARQHMDVWEKLAEDRNAQAQFFLSRALKIREEDQGSVFVWLLKAAEHGYNPAKVKLGLKFYRGKGVTQDYIKARELLEEAEQGSHENDLMFYTLGLIYNEGQGIEKNPSKANTYFERATTLGYAAASYRLGLNYYNGNGVDRNHVKACELFEEAEKNGLIFNDLGVIYCQLGLNYYNGDGVKENYARALEFFKKAEQRNHGNDLMFYTLGLIYNEGQGIEKDPTTANTYFERAMELGYAAASYRLGLNYYNGNGVDRDHSIALDLFKEAKKNYKNPMIFYNLALIYNKGPKYSKANKYFEKARQGDCAAASYHLGLNYYKGKGVKINLLEAIGYFEEAEQSGYRDGAIFNDLGAICCSLGMNYYYGKGVTEDDVKARELFAKAETRGYKDGWMFNALGFIYQYGEGVDHEYTKANAYFEKARQEGYAVASRNLGVNYYDGKGVTQNYGEARELFEEAEARDYKDGWMFNALGLIYDGGKGVAQNYTIANAYYEKARREGYAVASRNLGMNYYDGRGVTQNYGEACKLFEEAEARGHKDGWMFNTLGFIYQYGMGVAQNYTIANAYYEKARQEGYAAASYILGRKYYNGDGVTQDYGKARELFEEAEAKNYMCNGGWMFNALGLIYHEEGTAQDYAKANAYFEKARQKGSAVASYNLGRNYYDGRGVMQDYGKARELFEEAEARDYKDGWMFNALGIIHRTRGKYSQAHAYFEKARAKGYAVASYNLGMNYYYGNGVPHDYDKVRRFFEEAKQGGYQDGWMLYTLGTIYEEGRYVKKSFSRANDYFKEAGELGHAAALRNLGMNYYDGKGVTQNYGEARKLLHEAEVKGYKDRTIFYSYDEVFNTLGLIYEDGKDYAKANAYYEKARQEGSAVASRNLGMNYYDGKGVTQNYGEARKLLHEAEARGYKDGWMFNTLGFIYHDGKDVAQDYAKANAYYEKARQEGEHPKLRCIEVNPGA